jgi:hypothetical protein
MKCTQFKYIWKTYIGVNVSIIQLYKRFDSTSLSQTNNKYEPEIFQNTLRAISINTYTLHMYYLRHVSTKHAIIRSDIEGRTYTEGVGENCIMGITVSYTLLQI